MGKMQKGAFVLGAGFILETEQAELLISQQPKLVEVLAPFISGEDVNSSPDSSPSRFIINFRDWPRERATHYENLYRRLEDQVKPLREKDKIKSRRELWWQFAVRARGIHQAVEDSGHAVVVAVVSKYGLPVRIPAGPVIASTVAICADSSLSRFAEISCSAHNAWAWQWGSTMKTDLRYNPSDVFDTYPFIGPNQRLEEIGFRLNAMRTEIMHRRKLGLTKLYNFVNDRSRSDAADVDVAQLRQNHRELDQEIVAAYGWQDIDLEHGFHIYRQVERWSISVGAREELLDRLLEENHRRASIEATSLSSVQSKRRTRRGGAVSDDEGTLFE